METQGQGNGDLDQTIRLWFAFNQFRVINIQLIKVKYFWQLPRINKVYWKSTWGLKSWNKKKANSLSAFCRLFHKLNQEEKKGENPARNDVIWKTFFYNFSVST